MYLMIGLSLEPPPPPVPAPRACVQKTVFIKLATKCQLTDHLSPADLSILYQMEVRPSSSARLLYAAPSHWACIIAAVETGPLATVSDAAHRFGAGAVANEHAAYRGHHHHPHADHPPS
jgi:hypothetical protein